jgi:hypothetical protein
MDLALLMSELAAEKARLERATQTDEVAAAIERIEKAMQIGLLPPTRRRGRPSMPA